VQSTTIIQTFSTAEHSSPLSAQPKAPTARQARSLLHPQQGCILPHHSKQEHTTGSPHSSNVGWADHDDPRSVWEPSSSTTRPRPHIGPGIMTHTFPKAEWAQTRSTRSSLTQNVRTITGEKKAHLQAPAGSKLPASPLQMLLHPQQLAGTLSPAWTVPTAIGSLRIIDANWQPPICGTPYYTPSSYNGTPPSTCFPFCSPTEGKGHKSLDTTCQGPNQTSSARTSILHKTGLIKLTICMTNSQCWHCASRFSYYVYLPPPCKLPTRST
jgi:hypothetical protein